MRIRRTNKEVEEDIFGAITTLSKSVELTDITLNMVAKEAKMDMKVLRRRYADSTELLDAYSSQFDIYLSELMKSGNHISDKSERYGFILGRFLDWVSNNEQIRQLLLWELNDSSDLGYIIGQKRDDYLVRLLSVDFGPQTPGSEKEHLRGQIILYLAGLTYLYLNRSDAAFMGIKHFSNEGKKSLQEGLVRLLKVYFSCDK